MTARADQQATPRACPITSVAFDDRIDWTTFVQPPDWSERRTYAYGRRYTVADGANVFLFGFGAVVYDGAERLPDGLRTELEQRVGRRLLDETAETYFVSVDPRAEQGMRVGWDRVVIPERRPELIAAIAMLLGQSAALERYELAVDSLLDRTLLLSRQLAQHGRLPYGTRKLIERVGRLAGDRLELARWFFLVDRPEETWEDPRVAQLYDALFSNLELRQRHDAMLHKLSAAEHATHSTLELWHGRRSNALEWAIVLLIIVEIVFGVWGVL